jgi:hypothetical protein
MGRVTARWPEFQSSSLLICKPKQSTVDQSGHITARTLTRVRVRVKTRVRYMGRVTALWPEFQSALLLQCRPKSKLSTAINQVL